MNVTSSTLARAGRFGRFRSERGMSLIQVALLLLVMMGFSMFVTDSGVLWLARGQAQNAADAGALAGATSLAFDDPNDFSTTGKAYLAATNSATSNTIFGTSPTSIQVYLDPAQYPSWLPQPVPAVCPAIGGCAQVNVYRTGMPTYFANVFGITSQQIRATATAQARGANSVRCLKPWGMADKWGEQRTATAADDGVWHSGENGDVPISSFDKYYLPPGPNVLAPLPTPPALDYYNPPTNAGDLGTSFVAKPWPTEGDLGRQLALTVGKQNDVPPNKVGDPSPFVSGWFIPVSWGTGTGDYINDIKHCHTDTISIGQNLYLDNVPGNRVQKTEQAVGCGPPLFALCNQDDDSLYKQDPTAHWDNTCKCVMDSAHAVSPRIVPVALVSIDDYIQANNTGKSTITLINMIGVFIDGFRESDNKVVVHVVPMPGEFVNGAGTVSAGSSFLKYISLVR
jgi:hypothetical protein